MGKGVIIYGGRPKKEEKSGRALKLEADLATHP